MIEQALRDPGSALARAAAPDEGVWAPGDFILADLFDVFTRVHFKDPKPYPRPGDTRQRAEETERREARLKAQKARAERQMLMLEGGGGG